MWETITSYFSESGFMPHGHCYLWKPGLVTTHLISDILIGTAYTVISITLYGLVRKIKIPFSPIILSFGLFIGACGATHWMEVWTLWYPNYWWSGFTKVVTATASVATGIWLLRLRHPILKIAETAKLSEKRKIDLEVLTKDLERRVAERTVELSKSQALTKKAAEQLRIITDGIPVLVSYVDRSLRYQFVNAAYEKWYGVSKEEIIGKNLVELMGPDQFEKIIPYFKRALAGDNVSYQVCLKSWDGEDRYLEVNYVPDSGDEVHGVIVLANDVTSRRKVEDNLRESEEAYRTIFDLSGIGKEEVDAQTGRFLRVNYKFCEMTGYSRDELLQRTFLDITHPDDREREWNQYLKIRSSSKNQWAIEKRYIRRDGTTCWGQLHGTFIRDQNGTILRSIASVQDITEEKLNQNIENILNQTSLAITSSLNYKEILTTVAQLSVPFVSEWCIVDLFNSNRGVERIAVVSRDPEDKIKQNVFKNYPIEFNLNNPIIQKILAGESVFFQDPKDVFLNLVKPSSELYDVVSGLDLQSMIIIPLTSRGRTLGCLIFLSSEKKSEFDRNRIKVAEDLARRSALAVDNALLYRDSKSRQELLQFIIDALPSLVAYMGRDLRYQFVNESGARWFGYTQNDLIHKHPKEVLGESVYHSWLGLFEQSLRGKRVEFEDQILSADGSPRTVWTQYLPQFSSNGSVLGCLIVTTDITDIRTSERNEKFLSDASKIFSSSLDYSTTLNSVASLIVSSLADWCFIDILGRNGDLERIEVASSVLKSDEKLEQIKQFHPTQEHLEYPPIKAITSGKSVFWKELTYDRIESMGLTSEYTETLFLLSPRSLISVPLSVRGKILGAMTLVTSKNSGRFYTERDLILAEELANRAALAMDNSKLYEEARNAVQARDEFLSIASHELKTPLTSLAIQTQLTERNLMMRGETVAFAPDKMKKLVEQTSKQIKRLAHLVDDMLDISRISTGKLALNPETFDLAELIDEVVERMKPQLEKAGCKVTIQSEKGLVGKWDRFRVEQVLVNLLSNASRYGAGKPIEVNASKHGHSIEMSVQDYGRGIAKEDQERIFQRFERAISVSEISGLGLGLYIVKQILNMHQGTIRVESDLHHGAKFTVVLPESPQEQVA